MEFPQQNQEKPEPAKRPRGRPPVKAQFLPDSARDSVQIVKSEYIKKDDNGIPKKIMTVAESKALQGEKKPLSEAQKANLKRMLELNKARRDASKKVEIPEEVPEGYDAIYVPPKKNTALSSQARELMQPKPQPPQPQPPQPQSSIPPEWLEMMRQMNDRMNMLTTQYSKTKESKAKPRPPKKPSRRRDDTSDTQDTETETETGYDTSDTEYVKKYEKKAARRMEAVKEIEAKLQKKVNPPPPPKPRTKYDGLSIF
jgi:hypothetical protein